jgi:hypothetical protein
MFPPADSWKPVGGSNPTLQILWLLAASLGLPYFVLSTTGPLVQQWFSRANPGRSPYRLYALSNAGSLLALVSYPFFFEPRFTRKAQAWMWVAGVVAYAVCCGICALKLWKLGAGEGAGRVEPGAEERTSATEAQLPAPSRALWLLWLFLPACASALLLATTNKMCQDVAVIPFLWVLPLALYLLSFIISFDSPRWYVRGPFALALVAASAGICWALFQGTDLSIRKQVMIYSMGLFVCCMVCHGELYRLRPDPRFLTGFYLMIAAGGALGGLFVAAVAPLIFREYYELHWSLFGCGLLFLVVCASRRSRTKHADADTGWGSRFFELLNGWRLMGCGLMVVIFAGFDQAFARANPVMRHTAGQKFPGFADCARGAARWLDWLATRVGLHAGSVDTLLATRLIMWGLLALLVAFWVFSGRFKAFKQWRLMTCTWLVLLLVGLALALRIQAVKKDGEVVSRSRNFYGVLTVLEYGKDEPSNHYYLLQHGRITHGIQLVDPESALIPTTYYGEESGVGLAVQALPERPRRLGLIGLGTGSFSVYARPGDDLRIYEINPDVIRLADSQFTYLAACRTNATVSIALGDARLSLEREAPHQFDLLALDAFSGDAIPAHLMTKESFALYARHLQTNGIIAVHISNRYLDLEPVVLKLADEIGFQTAVVDYDEVPGEWWLYGSTWVLLTRDKTILEEPPILDSDIIHGPLAKKKAAALPLWTDDFTSLYQIIK